MDERLARGISKTQGTCEVHPGEFRSVQVPWGALQLGLHFYARRRWADRLGKTRNPVWSCQQKEAVSAFNHFQAERVFRFFLPSVTATLFAFCLLYFYSLSFSFHDPLLISFLFLPASFSFTLVHFNSFPYLITKRRRGFCRKGREGASRFLSSWTWLNEFLFWARTMPDKHVLHII